MYAASKLDILINKKKIVINTAVKELYFSEEEEFVMSYANLKEILQNEIFEVAEKECDDEDPEYDLPDYDLTYKTFGEMMASDLCNLQLWCIKWEIAMKL